MSSARASGQYRYTSRGRMTMTKSITTGILRPGEPGYDAARTVWNAMVDRRPALIVRCQETQDVVHAVELARREGLEIGIRCGGHSVVGHAVPEGGLMIDLTPMGGVRVDPERRRAWVQGGALLGALDAATQRYGLATTAGNVSHTGGGGNFGVVTEFEFGLHATGTRTLTVELDFPSADAAGATARWRDLALAGP